MTAMRIATCSGPRCRARIVWAVTQDGKRQPFDAVPALDGEWTLDTVCDPPRAEHAPIDLFNRDTRIRFKPHHATCVDVDLFKKARRP